MPSTTLLNHVNLARTKESLARVLGVSGRPDGQAFAAELLKVRDDSGGHVASLEALSPILQANPAAAAAVEASLAPPPDGVVDPALGGATAAVPGPQPSTTALSANSRAVLSHLADAVGGMARSAAVEAQLAGELGPSYKDYVHATRALLTGGDMPVAQAESGSAPIAAPLPSAVAATQATGAYLSNMANALAERGTANAKELQNVQKKEDEEKKGGPGKTGDPSGAPGTTGDPTKKQLPTPVPPPPTGGDSSGGDTTAGGSKKPDPPPGPGDPTSPGGTTTKDPTTGKPGDGEKKKDGKNGGGSHPGSISKPKKKIVRRCYHFWLRNTGKTEITDSHFMGANPAGDLKVPAGWRGLKSAPGTPPAFGWETDPGKGVKPGESSKIEFSFCLDDPVTGDIYLSHADGSRTKLGPGDVVVKGGAPKVNQNGDAVITSSEKSYITQYDVTVGDSGKVSLTVPGGGATGGTVTDASGNQFHFDVGAAGDRIDLSSWPRRPGGLTPGSVLTLDVETKGPNATVEMAKPAAPAP
jgi:hypothetical protein